MSTALALASVMLGVVAGYAWLALQWVAAGVPAWLLVAATPLVFFVIPFVATVVWFSLAAALGSPVPAAHRLTWRKRIPLFWNEWLAITRSGPRMVLYRLLLRDPPAAPASAPVLLLHGVLCNAGVWAGVARQLRRDGLGPVYTLTYGPPLASIDVFAEQLAAKVAAIRGATGAAQVAIVAHSMGGLVARAYLHRYGTSAVRLLMTLGTPHHGSYHAYLFPGTCLAQLRPGNAWLAALNALGPSQPGCRIVSLWSRHDSMVSPQDSSHLESAIEIIVDGVGHNALLGDAGVHAAIVRELRASAATATRDAANAAGMPAVG